MAKSFAHSGPQRQAAACIHQAGVVRVSHRWRPGGKSLGVFLSASGLDCRCAAGVRRAESQRPVGALNSLRRKVALNQEVTENSPIIP